jgi:hypothetical protein
MNTTHRFRVLTRTVILLATLTTLPAAETKAPATVTDALAQGKVSLNVRARYEGVQQTNLKDADALTLRTRLGYTTAAYEGLKAMIELENIASPSGDNYSQAGINPGGAGRAVVADPEGSEVNQAWLAYTADQTTATLGRQRLVLDNARFVGDVAWRQNMQTFDALVLQNKSIAKLALTYAYLNRIDRVFGDKHAQGRWDADSHLFNGSYTGLKAGTLTGYAYLLDFKNAAAQSCATYGLSFAGAAPVNKNLKVSYRAEIATQSDYGSSTLNYQTSYYTFEGGLSSKPGALAIGYEVLGSDNGVSFRTPLATLHAFNGWADLFLTTPGNGLRDTYVKVAATLPEGFSFLGFYHWFEAARLGADYGKELDLQLSRKFGKMVTGTLKYAQFDRDSTAFSDVKKVWIQVDFAY